jgi:hypothetical protein
MATESETMELVRASQKPKGTYEDYVNKQTAGKQFVFELIQSNGTGGSVRSKETGRTQAFPLTYSIPMNGRIFWKDANGNTAPRNIRYVPGENSIFNDEQTPDDKYPKKKVRALFTNGRLHIDGADGPRLKFMMEWDANETKPNRDQNKSPLFKLVDTGKVIAKARQADKIKFDVVNWCYTADFKTQIHPLASLFFSDEQLRQNTDDVRWNLKLKAEADPTAFKAILDDPKTEKKVIVKRAIAEGFLVINPAHNSLAWRDQPNQPISVAVFGKDPVTDFVEKADGGDNKRYYDAIYDLVNPTPKKLPASEIVAEPKTKEEFKAPLIEAPKENDDELFALYERAIEKGIVVSKGPAWMVYRGKSVPKGKRFIQALKDAPNMLQLLKEDLAK